MPTDDGVDVAGQDQPSRVQRDDLVAGGFRFAENVAGQHHGDAALGDVGHQAGQDLLAGQRIEV